MMLVLALWVLPVTGGQAGSTAGDTGRAAEMMRERAHDNQLWMKVNPHFQRRLYDTVAAINTKTVKQRRIGGFLTAAALVALAGVWWLLARARRRVRDLRVASARPSFEAEIAEIEARQIALLKAVREPR
ncbi:hypothetical protein A6A05_00635 [Magnetospirillum moscoviense]|uniref:Transmembrane protein n=1 Tax=Magnetospirillum moscoviense TaxID=1437059 RepID=A0A178MW95_9PROT|nr:hypothetical protein A6A05_00635 [Magnetospirillum moscoviense]